MSDELRKNTKGAVEPAVSERSRKRLARASGLIADQIILEKRPDAPVLEIERIVAKRCTRAGLPVPSRKSLTARIAFVRRHGALGKRFQRQQVTVDHCAIEGMNASGQMALATLSVVILDPGGLVIAWHLQGDPPNGSIDAALLAQAQRAATGTNRARANVWQRDVFDDATIAALNSAHVISLVHKAYPARGTDLRRVLGRRIGRHRFRPTATDPSHNAPRMDAASLETLRAEILPELVSAGRPKPGRRPDFMLAHPASVGSLLNALDRIAAGAVSKTGRRLLAPEEVVARVLEGDIFE